MRPAGNAANKEAANCSKINYKIQRSGVYMHGITLRFAIDWRSTTVNLFSRLITAKPLRTWQLILKLITVMSCLVPLISKVYI